MKTKFKAFLEVTSDEIFAQAVEFSKTVNVKSLGVEFLEKDNCLFLTLGYEESESNPVSFAVHRLGNHASLEMKEIESLMSEHSERYPNIICHEMYVEKDEDIYAVFMCK